MNPKVILSKISSNIETLSIDEVKEQLRPLFRGMTIESPIPAPGAYLYRARKIGTDFNKAEGISYRDLIYPPQEIAKLGRLNKDGQSVFYCSFGKEALFYELPKLKAGDELVISFWQTTEEMILNNIGYTQLAFEKLGAKRPCPIWSSSLGSSHAVISLPEIQLKEQIVTMGSDVNREVREALSHEFVCAVDETEKAKYKLTTAIGELHLGSINNGPKRFAGLLYPSVRMLGNGDNLALQPWFVDKHLSFRKALHIRIDSVQDTAFSITSLDCAKNIGQDGKLVWFGRLPNWSVLPGQSARFEVKSGRDADGDYETGKNGELLYWLACDSQSGEIIEPA